MCSTKKALLLLFFLNFCLLPSAQGQENLTGYWNPQLSLNYNVTPIYSHNFSLENRSYVYRNSDLQLRTRQMDINHFSGLKISDNQSIGVGIKYRIRESFDSNSQNELRLTEQYNIILKRGSLRIGNRFRAEQRITNENIIHRFRYRFAADLPLRGEELNVGEPYLVLSTESLLSIGKSMAPEYDQRITSKLGWVLNPSTKVQFGGEYRAENYTSTVENELFFLSEIVLSL